MTETSGLGRSNRKSKANTECNMFPVPAFYDANDGGKSNVMLGQEMWFDRRALEQGGFVLQYSCDGWILGGMRLEKTDS